MKHKIFSVLRSFSQEEVINFKKFIISPYFNSNKKLISLYECLMLYYPDFKTEELNKHDIFSKLYPTKHYKDSTLRNILYDMYELSLKFLSHEQTKNDTSINLRSLHKQLFKKKLFEILENSIKNNLQNFNNPIKSDNDFLKKFELNIDILNYNITLDKNEGKGVPHNSILALNEAGKNLIFYFTIEYLQLYDNYIILLRNKDIKETNNLIISFFETFNIPKAIDFITRKFHYQYPILEIYLSLIQVYLSKNNRKQVYKKTIKLLDKYENMIPIDELNFFYLKIVQFWMILNKENNYLYQFELMEIYIKIVDKGYYKHTLRSSFPLQLFRNIIHLGMRVKNLKWLSKFIKYNIPRLNKHLQEGMQNYSMAYLAFSQHDFNKSLNYASQVYINYPAIIIDIKILLLKLYFELNFLDTAILLINSFKIALNKEFNQPSSRKIKSKNFIKFLNRLIFIKNSKRKIRSDYIRSEIAECDEVFEKEWLTQKVEELFTTYKGVI